MSREPATKASCIICAHNEGPRIAAVLRATRQHPLLSEVIVVDDGSTDDTSAVARTFACVTLIENGRNRGKSFSLMTGIAAASSPFILLLDADLENLQAHHVTALLAPVLNGAADVTLSLRRNSLGLYRMLGLDWLSGERAFAKATMTDYERLADLDSYVAESFFNEQIVAKRLRITVVEWPDVRNVTKGAKHGLLRGVRDELAMSRQIVRHLGLVTCLRLMAKMAVLRTP